MYGPCLALGICFNSYWICFLDFDRVIICCGVCRQVCIGGTPETREQGQKQEARAAVSWHAEQAGLQNKLHYITLTRILIIHFLSSQSKSTGLLCKTLGGTI